MFTFGSNSEGQLGVDDRLVQVSSAPLLVSILKGQGVQAKTVSCGGHHTGVLTNEGRVYMWGRNDKGQAAVPLSSKT